MGKSVEWGIEKNYHYELKIGIAEKIFIHSEFNNRKGKKLDFPPFLSPLLPSIHSASALLIIMMLLMLQNVSVYPCRYRERHTILNMSNMAYLYRIHPPPPLVQINEIIRQWHNAFIQFFSCKCLLLLRSFSIPYKRQFSIIHLAFSHSLYIAVNPVLWL